MPGGPSYLSEHLPPRATLGKQGLSIPATPAFAQGGGAILAFETDGYTYSPDLAVGAGGYTFGVNGENMIPVGSSTIEVTFSGTNMTIPPGWAWWGAVVITGAWVSTPPVINSYFVELSAFGKASVPVGLFWAIGPELYVQGSGYSGPFGQTLPVATATPMGIGVPAFTIHNIRVTMMGIYQPSGNEAV